MIWSPDGTLFGELNFFDTTLLILSNFSLEILFSQSDSLYFRGSHKGIFGN